MFAAAVFAAALAAAPMIRPGQPWHDTAGNVIDAHGAGILEHEGKYYWYGSRRTMNATGTQMDGGIALYSSPDLYAWTFESVVMPVFNCSDNNTGAAPFFTAAEAEAEEAGTTSSDSVKSREGTYPPPSCKNGNGLDLERPKVVQCGGPGNGGQFVMWVRGTGYGNSPQLLGVAVSDSPKGPFAYVSNKTGSDDPFVTIGEGAKNYPLGYQYADATLYQEPAPPYRTYVYWRSRMTTGVDGGPTGFRAMELTSDCKSVVVGSDTRVTATANREGPAMFFHADQYYLYVSGTMGWSPTAMYVYSAKTPLGNFSASSMDDHYWHAYSKGAATYNSSSHWNGKWTVTNGELLVGAPWGNASRDGNGGSDGVNISFGGAKTMCAEAAKCAGFTFIDFDAAPAANKQLLVTFKSVIQFWPEKEVGLQPPPIPIPGQPGNVAPDQPGAWAYDSQSTYILPNPAYTAKQATQMQHRRDDAVNKVAPFIYMGDRWNYTNTFGTSQATYIWLPLYIDPAHPQVVKVVWSDGWALDDESLYPF